MTSDIPLKKCTVCGEEKPATPELFSRQKRNRGGLYHQCRDCCNARRQERRRANPEQTRAELKRYRNTDKYRVKHAVYEKQRRKSDPDAFRAYRQGYYNRKLKSQRVLLTPEQKRERARAALRSHWKRNREDYKSRTRAYLARKRGARGVHTADDVNRMLASQGHQCFWCGCDISGGIHHVDHYHPLSRGGTNGPENIVGACETCNKSKGRKTPEEYMAYLNQGVPAIGSGVPIPE